MNSRKFFPPGDGRAARVLERALRADRNVLIQAMRSAFFEGMKSSELPIASWSVGIVLRRPPSGIRARQAGSGAYLLYCDDFWLRDPESMQRLRRIVEESTHVSIGDRVASATTTFVEDGLGASIGVKQEFGQDAAIRIREQLSSLLLTESARRAAALDSHGLDEALKRAKNLPRDRPPSHPDDDLAWRLLQAPFGSSGQASSGRAALMAADDQLVWLGVEAVLKRLLASTPQVGGHGEKAMKSGEPVAALLTKGAADPPLDVNEACLRIIEEILFSPPQRPFFVAYPVLARAFGGSVETTGDRTIGYCYAVGDLAAASDEAELRGLMVRVLEAITSMVGDPLRSWVDKDFSSELASARNEEEQRKIIEAHLPTVTGGANLRVLWPTDGSTECFCLLGPHGDVQLAHRSDMLPGTKLSLATHLQLLANAAITEAELSRNAVAEATAEAGYLSAHDISRFIDELPVNFLVRQVSCLTETREVGAASGAAKGLVHGVNVLRSKLGVFAGYCELQRCLGKFTSGAFERTWLDPDVQHDNPAVQRARIVKAFDAAVWSQFIEGWIVEIVSSRRVDQGLNVVLRSVHESGVRVREHDTSTVCVAEMKGYIKPFLGGTDGRSLAPKLAVLMPVAELVRNAVHSVENSHASLMEQMRTIPPIYFGVQTKGTALLVSVYNPISAGTRLDPGDSVPRLQRMFSVFGSEAFGGPSVTQISTPDFHVDACAPPLDWACGAWLMDVAEIPFR